LLCEPGHLPPSTRHKHTHTHTHTHMKRERESARDSASIARVFANTRARKRPHLFARTPARSGILAKAVFVGANTVYVSGPLRMLASPVDANASWNVPGQPGETPKHGTQPHFRAFSKMALEIPVGWPTKQSWRPPPQPPPLPLNGRGKNKSVRACACVFGGGGCGVLRLARDAMY